MGAGQAGGGGGQERERDVALATVLSAYPPE